MSATIKMLGRGRTPMDVSINNWAIKIARAHVVNMLEAQGKYATVYKIGQIARVLVEEDDKWILLAQKKVLGRKKARTGGRT